jgi:hypothetical protein
MHSSVPQRSASSMLSARAHIAAISGVTLASGFAPPLLSAPSMCTSSRTRVLLGTAESRLRMAARGIVSRSTCTGVRVAFDPGRALAFLDLLVRVRSVLLELAVWWCHDASARLGAPNARYPASARISMVGPRPQGARPGLTGTGSVPISRRGVEHEAERSPPGCSGPRVLADRLHGRVLEGWLEADITAGVNPERSERARAAQVLHAARAVPEPTGSVTAVDPLTRSCNSPAGSAPIATQNPCPPPAKGITPCPHA